VYHVGKPKEVKNGEGLARGLVLMIDRGCKTLSAGQEEQIVELKEAGIPRMVYEGSHADFRDLMKRPRYVDSISS
jgi:hypothetical protein